MMHNWRKIESGDYQMLVSWWEQWGWDLVPTPDMLPSTGYMVYDEESGIPLYAAFIYYTGTSMAWIEYIVSNKHADVKIKKGALQYLLNVMGVIAKEHGVASLFTSTSEIGLVNSLKKGGFDASENNVQLIKNL